MKFQPKEDFELPQDTRSNSILGRIKNFFSPPKPAVAQIQPSTISHASQPSQISNNNRAKLRFIKKLTNEDVLIGNEDQLDVISIGGIVQNFVDTEFRWSLNIRKAIVQVGIDQRSMNLSI